jgi:hypothetical protein
MKYLILLSVIIHAFTLGNPFVIDTFNGRLPLYMALLPASLSLGLIFLSIGYIIYKKIIFNLIIISVMTVMIIISAVVFWNRSDLIFGNYIRLLSTFVTLCLCSAQYYNFRKIREVERGRIFE